VAALYKGENRITNGTVAGRNPSDTIMIRIIVQLALCISETWSRTLRK
jgi:hypothetical protein